MSFSRTLLHGDGWMNRRSGGCMGRQDRPQIDTGMDGQTDTQIIIFTSINFTTLLPKTNIYSIKISFNPHSISTGSVTKPMTRKVPEHYNCSFPKP
jgi:hypothetical protein